MIVSKMADIDSRIDSIEKKLDMLIRNMVENDMVNIATKAGAIDASFFHGTLYYKSTESVNTSTMGPIRSALMRYALSNNMDVRFSYIGFDQYAMDIL